jgi:hypothetical protein
MAHNPPLRPCSTALEHPHVVCTPHFIVSTAPIIGWCRVELTLIQQSIAQSLSRGGTCRQSQAATRSSSGVIPGPEGGHALTADPPLQLQQLDPTAASVWSRLWT